jgi:hypothetical protein
MIGVRGDDKTRSGQTFYGLETTAATPIESFDKSPVVVLERPNIVPI